ncbi:MAG: heparinase II/III family protein, partial [Anaerolineae bacterium]
PAQYVLDALRAWDSAVAQDTPDHASIFETIAQDQGDWLRGLAYHLVYGSIDAYGDDGKLTLLRGGDMPSGQAYPNKQYRPFTDAIARIYDDPVLATWGASLEKDWSFVGGTGTYHTIHRYALPLDLPVGVGSRGPSGLPLARIWGRGDVGYILARSSWAPGKTLVGYRAGKWFTGHQHMDQGHMDIWRKGPLAVDSGVYAAWGTRHREAYYIRTVAHNTLLVPQAGETFDEHPQSPVHVNDGGQRILTYRGCPQCMQSVEEWRGNVGDGLHFEAGAVEAFVNEAPFLAVASDLTSAYNSTRFAAPDNVAKVASVERDLVFLRPRLLLVADRVRITGTTSAPRFVLHFPRRPTAPDIQVVEGTLEDGILTSPGPTFTMDNGTGGRLIGRTLVPRTVTMTLIGGSRHRYWVDGANQLDGSRSEEKPPAEPGTWRLEVQSTAAGRDYLMLHALTITDEGGNEIASRLLPVTSDPAGGGTPLAVAAGDSGATVLMSGTVPRGAVTYAEYRSAGAGLLVATNLRRDAPYRVAFGKSAPAALRASSGPEATWPVEVPGAGPVFLGLCPAPPGAGDNWVALCTDPTPTPTATPTATATPEVPEGYRLFLPALGS